MKESAMRTCLEVINRSAVLLDLPGSVKVILGGADRPLVTTDENGHGAGS
jgi:hypothetical protein